MDRKPVTVRSYANIAIIKYWGKKKKGRFLRPAVLRLLENMYTEHLIFCRHRGRMRTADAFYINGRLQSEAEQDEQNHQLVTVQKVRDLSARYPKQHATAAGRHPVLVVCLLGQGLQCLFQLGLNRSQLRRRLSLPQGRPLAVFMDAGCLQGYGEIYPVETDLKLATKEVGAGGQEPIDKLCVETDDL